MRPAPISALLAIVEYIGGKNQVGTAAKIINLTPPHSVYIEPFLGSGAILRLKRPADRSYGIDLAPALFPALRTAAPNLALLQGCGISFLEYYPWTGREFVYCDPPYLLSTRGGRKYYEHEMPDADHARLLRVAVAIPAMVMISGYDSEMYNAALVGWHRREFEVETRGHTKAIEVLWFNYEPPLLLHDDRYTGADFRERWRIEKKRRNAVRKFRAMPPLERDTIFSALVDVMAEDRAQRSAARPTSPAPDSALRSAAPILALQDPAGG